MTEQIFKENNSKHSRFWSTATKYAASAKNDDGFVSEIAYMMVTLHRTGA